MSYLLDTCVISETVKKNPAPKVTQWLSGIGIDQLFLSVITLGEIRKGINSLEDSLKKQNILQWLETDLYSHFLGRTIAVDHVVVDKWGYISARFTIPAIDGLIAASALVHNLKLVTRNTKDFENIQGLEVINPWTL